MPSEPAAEPRQLTIAAARRTLVVHWQDDHVSPLPWWYLRGWCPCAGCQGHGGQPQFRPAPERADLVDVREVGHYALNLVWQDGHNTGIYPFVLLRSLCACGACRQLGDGGRPYDRTPAAQQAALAGEVDLPT